MSEPRRLREISHSPAEHALLSAGVTYRSSDAAHAKTLAALGLAGSTALTAGAASAGASSLLTKAGWGKLLSTVSLVGVAALPIGYYALDGAATPHTATPAPLREPAPPFAKPLAPLLPPATSATVGAPESPSGAQAEAELAADKLKASRVQRSVKAERSAPLALSAELDAIDAARAALARGDSGRALACLDGYARAFPKGRLALEAEVLRIDALSRGGQAALASRRAEAFLKRQPNSVLASRVRGYVID